MKMMEWASQRVSERERKHGKRAASKCCVLRNSTAQYSKNRTSQCVHKASMYIDEACGLVMCQYFFLLSSRLVFDKYLPGKSEEDEEAHTKNMFSSHEASFTFYLYTPKCLRIFFSVSLWNSAAQKIIFHSPKVDFSFCCHRKIKETKKKKNLPHQFVHLNCPFRPARSMENWMLIIRGWIDDDTDHLSDARNSMHICVAPTTAMLSM
jgi:hypothetical protein